MLGRSPADLIVEEQRDNVRSLMAAALTGDGKVEPTEYLGRKIDGSTLPVEVLGRRITFKGRPAILATVRDISARKGAERARLRAETELKRVLDSVPDLVWSGEITPAGVIRFRWSSPALESLTGRPSSFWRGEQLRWLAIVHPADRQRVKELADQLISGERDRNEQEYRIVRPDGTVRWVRDSAAVTDGADGLRPIQGIISDITERKALTEHLLRAQKLESGGRLAGGVAHSFNNALTSIYGRCEFVRNRLDPADPSRQDVERILAVAKGAAHITRQLLAFSRQKPLQTTIVDPADVIRAATDLAQPLIGEHLDVATHLETGLARIKADGALLEQALLNLLLNARDAMSDGGVITVSASTVLLDARDVRNHEGLQPGCHVRVDVTDTGSGISPEVRQHIFEPFFTTKDVGQGVGLGLAMVHGCVKQFAGEITVTSAPAQGTTVTILLPGVTDVADATTEPDPAMPHRAAVSGGTILVVEDEDAVRAIVCETLRQGGFRVVSARSGRHALQLAEHEHTIDLLLTDVVMPEMTGADLAHASRPGRPAMRVIFMSGYPTPLTGLASSVARDNVVLPKPFLQQTLITTVHDALSD